MDDYTKRIAEQAGFEYSSQWTYWTAHEPELERFAELIRLDETKSCAEHYLGIMRDAVEQAIAYERDKCAQDYLQDCSDAVEAARLEERKEIAEWLMTGIRLDGLDTEPLVLQYTLDFIGAISKLIRERGEK